MNGVPDISSFRTIAEAFDVIAARHPDKDCICLPAMAGRDYHPEGIIWSYAEIANQAAALREVYAAAGYGHGHRIALMFDNRPTFVVHWLALNALGVSVVPVNQDSTAHEIATLLARSHAILCVVLPSREGLFLRAAELMEKPIPVAAAEWPVALPAASTRCQPSLPSRLTETGLLFTSGTTGVSKGAMLTNESLFFNAERYIAADGLMAITYGEERLYNPLPVYYANAFAHTNIVMILSAGCMIFPDRFHPGSWWKDVVETGATIIHYLGIIAPVLLKRDASPLETAHRVKFGLGSGVDSNQHIAWEKRFGFPLMEVYGMTELGICSFASTEPRFVGQHYVGQPIGDVEYRIVDSDGNDVAVGEAGEVLVRRKGPDPRRGFFAGYLDNEDLTEHLWRGGWYHTGDMMRQDETGRYFFVDRLKHMIRRSGQNISAGEVENCLRMHPDVSEVACVPVPDEMRQEEVMACVVLKSDVPASESTALSIMEFALDRISYYKAPGGIVFMDKLPTTHTNKLQKDRIFAAGENPYARPQSFDLRHLKKRNPDRATL